MNCKKIKHILLGIAVVMFFGCSNTANESHTHSESCEHSHSHEGHEHSADCNHTHEGHNHEGHEHSHDCNHDHQPQQESFKVNEEGTEIHQHSEECNHQH